MFTISNCLYVEVIHESKTEKHVGTSCNRKINSRLLAAFRRVYLCRCMTFEFTMAYEYTVVHNWSTANERKKRTLESSKICTIYVSITSFGILSHCAMHYKFSKCTNKNKNVSHKMKTPKKKKRKKTKDGNSGMCLRSGYRANRNEIQPIPEMVCNVYSMNECEINPFEAEGIVC